MKEQPWLSVQPRKVIFFKNIYKFFRSFEIFNGNRILALASSNLIKIICAVMFGYIKQNIRILTLF